MADPYDVRMHRGERRGASGSSPVLSRRCQVPLPCESSAERCPIAAPQSPRLPLSPARMRTQQCPSESSGAHSAENCSSSGSSGLSPGSDSDSSGVVCGGGGMRGVLSRYWSLESLHSATGKGLFSSFPFPPFFIFFNFFNLVYDIALTLRNQTFWKKYIIWKCSILVWRDNQRIQHLLAIRSADLNLNQNNTDP